MLLDLGQIQPRARCGMLDQRGMMRRTDTSYIAQPECMLVTAVTKGTSSYLGVAETTVSLSLCPMYDLQASPLF